MKKISVVIPTYNEEGNIRLLVNMVVEVIEKKMTSYDYEVLIIDNDSKDNTRKILREMAKNNKKIKVILNAKNFGSLNSPYYGLLQSEGDCTVLLCADFQDPIELIENFVREWESGYKIVVGKKTSSRENKLVYAARTMYYKALRKFSCIEPIEHFTGFGLYDKSFIEILRKLNDPQPFLRGIVAELGYKCKEIEYEQQTRLSGKSSNNFFSLYDAAMLSFTSYTKIGLRIATFVGLITAIVSSCVAMFYFIYKLLYWKSFETGMAPLLLCMLFLGSVVLIFLGIIGEYILNINIRIMNRPLVIEEERINFN